MNTALTLQIGGDISKLRTEVNKANGLMGNFNNKMSKVGTMIAGAFSAAAVIGFTKAVYQTTAQFQKFEAVLNTSLGSNSKAQLAMKQIEQFASVTPFSVQELTNSFVKLANQGFAPTTNQLRRLGDLAASTGKSFDQLAEAIIDAQTGEFERLKEFGIRAKKEGENVTFTFKGVETQTKFTADAIREYVLSLGDAVGVSGSMAAISDTLSGRMSNLGDSWDQFLKTLGDQGSGPFKNAINNLNLMLTAFTQAIKTSEQLEKDANLTAASKAVTNLQILAQSYGDLEIARTDYLKLLDGQLAAENKYNRSLSRLEDDNEQKITASYEKIRRIQAEIQAVKEYTEVVKKLVKPAPAPTTPKELVDIGAQRRARGDKPLPVTVTSKGSVMSDFAIDNTVLKMGQLKTASTETTTQIETEWVDLGGAISGALSTVADGLGQAIMGVGNFGETIIKALAGFARQIGEMLIGIGVGMLAAKMAIKNPFTAIAAGVALVALSGIMSAGLSKAQGNFNSSGSGGAPGFRPSEIQQVSVGGRIRGYDLAIVNEKEGYRRSRVG
jgi:hypothetical protein